MESKPLVVSLCDETGIMVRPWADAGFECICVDLKHSIRRDRVMGNVSYVWGDARSWTPPRIPSIVFAFPPCTHLTCSGSRDWRKKGLAFLVDALSVVEGCRRLAESFGCPYMIENPKGRLSTIWRKPDYKFDPCDFAGYLECEEEDNEDRYTKETYLWCGGDFVFPEKKWLKPVLGSKMHRIPPGPDRESIRSATPEGFAQAVFEANVGKVLCHA